MSQKNRIATTGIFFSAITILLIYLMSVRDGIHLPIYVFWISISLTFYVILYHSININPIDEFSKIILFEIIVLSLVLHLVYQIPYYGLYGTDAYYDLNSMKGILLSGHLISTLTYVNVTSYWPLIHIIGSIFSLISNINALNVAKWFPSLYGTIVPIITYLFIQKIFNDNRIALISTLLFVSLNNYIFFGSLFIRESLSLIFAIFCLYTYFTSNSGIKYSISILFLVATTLSHHLTALILAAIFYVHYIVSDLLLNHNYFFHKNITRKIVSKNILLLIIIIPVCYWVYVILYPLITVVHFFENLLNFNSPTYAEISGISSTSLPNIRSYILYFGFFIFNGIFGFLLSYQLIFKKIKKLEIYSFTIFLFMIGFIGFLFLYIIPLSSATLLPDRLLTYGWLLGFAPLSLFIVKINNTYVRKLGLFILFAFLIYNIYSIDVTTRNSQYNGLQISTSQEEYNLAKVVSIQKKSILVGHPSMLMAIYDTQNYAGMDLYSSKIKINDVNWIIINKNSLELKKKRIKNESVYFDLKGLTLNHNILKVYDSNNLVGFCKS